MNIFNSDFITSVASADKLISDGAREIAVAGKSNVGKSSFINFLCGRTSLAHTSSKPGLTRLVNYFSINNGEFNLVDLPGYGYARVSHTEKESWGKLIEAYLQSPHKKHVFLLLDIRHAPTEDDLLMIRYLYHYSIPFTLIATKADKLKRNEIAARKSEIASKIGVGVDDLLVVSSFAKTGKEEVLKKIADVLAH